jgi:hypothetical protein
LRDLDNKQGENQKVALISYMFLFVMQAIDLVTNSNNFFSFIIVVTTMVIVQQEITLDA